MERRMRFYGVNVREKMNVGGGFVACSLVVCEAAVELEKNPTEPRPQQRLARQLERRDQTFTAFRVRHVTSVKTINRRHCRHNLASGVGVGDIEKK